MPNPNAPQNLPDDASDYPEDFAASIAGEIGADLFAKTEPEAPVKVETPAPGSEQRSAIPSDQTAQPQNTPVAQPPVKALPKSWKKDMEPHWAKLDPAVHEYVYAREADVMRGIQQYQSGYESWNNLLKPYESVLAQHPDVNPVQLMQGLMNSHLALLNPQTPPEQKLQMVQQILQGYGLSLPANGDPAAAQNTPNPELQTLRQQVAELTRARQLDQQRQYQSGLTEQMRVVEAFAADPANKYFPEVANDIHRFIQSGAATDLASAYELACYANPAVRAKVLADQQAAAFPAPGAKPPRAVNGQFRNIDSPDPAKHRIPKGSIDDTIDSVVAKHYTNPTH
jgi:hypothetical protein